MNIGDQSELISRIKFNVRNADEQRPLAILAGSGISIPSVPGVVQILNSIRNAIDEADRLAFDTETDQFSDGGMKYQAAFAFLSRRMPTSIADRIISAATLKAYPKAAEMNRRLTGQEMSEAERDVDGWNLPKGVQSLGRIWAGLPPRLRGPIVTTNFDPLVEIAIQKAGSPAYPRAMDSDGTFIHDMSLNEYPQVIHIHGFWRESQTLHMPTQLTMKRPALAGSLRSLLSRYTLLVLGYSGWQDAVMLQLEAMIDEQSARDLDILWCSYSSPEELSSEIERNSSLSKLSAAMGHVQFYANIDANLFLPKLELELAEHLNYGDKSRDSTGFGSLIGWTPVIKSSFDSSNTRSARARAIDYFDGRVPALRDGYNEFIPSRDIVPTCFNELKVHARKRTNTFTVLVGASGEGKTTALIQIAARLSENSALDNIWIQLGGKIPSVTAILETPDEGKPMFLFLDEAHESMSQLQELVVKLNAESRQDIHIVAASRDTDWGAVGGNTFAWQNYIQYIRHSIRGVSRPDAAAVVSAWELFGKEGLRDLANFQDRERRIEEFLRAGREYGLSEDGTFFGAMLKIRYGTGLVEHIRNLLIRLKDRIFYSSGLKKNMSLAEAFIYIAIPHSHGVDLLNHSLLAKVLGLSLSELEMNVLLPLGEESPIAIEGRYIATRHRSISEAAVGLGSQIGFRVEDFYRDIVDVTVREIDAHGFDDRLIDIAYMSQRIGDTKLKVAAAEAAVEASPHRLSYRTSLSAAYRADGRYDDSIRIGLGSADLFSTATDRVTGVRFSLTEWGVCEGQNGDYATNAYLAGISLADLSADLDVHLPKLDKSLVCLGVAFEILCLSEDSLGYAIALSSVVQIGYMLKLDTGRQNQFESWEDVVANIRTSSRRNHLVAPLQETIQGLVRGVQLARQESRSEVVSKLSSFSIKYNKLQKALDGYYRRY